MRHRSATKHLSRNTDQRKSLFKNLLSALFVHGEIQTTEAKAKAIKGLADKLIVRAQPGTVAARRLLGRFFGTRAIVNRLVDEVAPAMKDRKSGFTRIIRLGKRMGDDSVIVKMELVNKPVQKVEVNAQVITEVEKTEEVAVKPEVKKVEKKK